MAPKDGGHLLQLALWVFFMLFAKDQAEIWLGQGFKVFGHVSKLSQTSALHGCPNVWSMAT